MKPVLVDQPESAFSFGDSLIILVNAGIKPCGVCGKEDIATLRFACIEGAPYVCEFCVAKAFGLTGSPSQVYFKYIEKNRRHESSWWVRFKGALANSWR